MEDLEMSEVPVKSVKKAFDLLSAIAFDAGEDGIALSELAARMKQPANSTRNLLKSMIAAGYVSQTERGRYVTGPRCRDLARLGGLRSAGAGELIDQTVRGLSRELGESVVFVTLADGRRHLLAHADPGRAIKVDVSHVKGPDPYEYVTGRVLLAHATDEERTRAFEHNGPPGARWNGIKTRKALERACEAVRKSGSATAQTDAEQTYSIAFPVLDGAGKLVGAMGVFAPEFRCLPKDRARIVKAMKAAAERLGRQLREGDMR